MHEAGDVVEVGAVRDRDDRASRLERPGLLGDRLGDARDRVCATRDEAGDPAVQRRLGLRRGRVGAPMRVRDERVAQVGDPADPRRARDRGGDQVRRSRRRGRDDDVDPVLAHEPDPGRDRGQRPGRVLVRHDEPPELEPCLRQRPLETLGAGEHLGRLAAAHPDVPGAVHPGLGRHAEALRRGGASAGRRARARASRCPSSAGTARA